MVVQFDLSFVLDVLNLCISPDRTACAKCPVGTEPAVGFEYKWWNTMPSNMKSSIFTREFSHSDHSTGERLHSTGWLIKTLQWAQTVAEWITHHYFEMIWWCFLRLLSIYVLCALLVWQQWCVLPFCLISNMHTAWEVAGEYVYTTPGDQDTDYLMLMLSVPGYRWSQIFL